MTPSISTHHIATFHYGHQPIRVAFDPDRTPYFIGVDLADALGYNRASGISTATLRAAGHVVRVLVNGKGQHLAALTEGGLLQLLRHSHKAYAPDFTNWFELQVRPYLKWDLQPEQLTTQKELEIKLEEAIGRESRLFSKLRQERIAHSKTEEEKEYYRNRSVDLLGDLERVTQQLDDYRKGLLASQERVKSLETAVAEPKAVNPIRSVFSSFSAKGKS